jgi:F-type H+-transporting ATPase subunit gamma
MSLKAVKNKIRSIGKIRQVTKAMEAVSAVKMRKSQQLALSSRPFAMSALSMLQRLSGTAEAKEHALITPRASVRKRAVLLITSDRGFSGALNANALKCIYKLFKEASLTKENTLLFFIGKKGATHFAARGWNIERNLDGWGEGVMEGDVRALAEDFIIRYKNENFDELHIVYTNFVSSFAQEPVVRKALPISPESVQELVDGIAPTMGKYSDTQTAHTEKAASTYLFEPSPSEVLDALIPYLLSVELYHALLESNASEHSSRMIAMKNASDRAGDMRKDLTREYNKERQGSITAEISEITSGIEAMS